MRCCASWPPTPASCRSEAGPVEAAAYGNVLVQARTAGVLTGGLADVRRLLHSTRTYVPCR